MSRPINQMMLNKPQVRGPAKGGSVRNTPSPYAGDEYGFGYNPNRPPMQLPNMQMMPPASPQPNQNAMNMPPSEMSMQEMTDRSFDGPRLNQGVLQGPQPNISQEYLPGANQGAKGGPRQRPFLTKPGITTPAKGGPRNPPAYRGPRRRMR